MPAPSATWSVKRVYATYRNRQTLALEAGTWTVTATGRIVNTLADGTKQIFRAGPVASGSLNTTPGQPSIDLDLPVTDDPDNSPSGGAFILAITFASGGSETYQLSPLMSWPSGTVGGTGGTDLAVLLDPEVIPSAPTYAMVGVPGGVAGLDVDGDVIDADGTKILATGGTDVELVRDTMAAALVAGTNVTITPNDAANTITIAATNSTDAEVVRDTMAAALVAGTNVTITPNDAGDTITIAAAGGSTDAEVVRDTIATALVAGANISITPNDAGDTITIASTSSGSSDDEIRASYGFPLDSFAGANDDAKLTTALTEAAAQTYPFTILLGNEQRTFTTANRVAFDGLRIQGPPGYGNPERLSSTKMPGRCHLSFSGSWFRNPLNTSVYSTSFHNLSFTGSGGASGPNVLGQNGTGSWYCLSMRDIFSSSLRSVLGTQATAMLITAANFTGDWEINNCYNGAFHLGGSDNTLWPDGMLLDSGTGFATAGSANGQYHIWFDYMEKTDIGPLFVTAEGPWSGILIEGPSSPATAGGSGNMGGPLRFHGMKIEGRNTNSQSNGSLIRQEGGIVILDGCWTSYAMGSPATTGHSPQDAGVIHQIGGQLVVDKCTYDKASSIANTVPYIYVASGETRVSNIMRASRGGSWGTNRPVVDDVSGTSVNFATGARVTDGTFTVI